MGTTLGTNFDFGLDGFIHTPAAIYQCNPLSAPPVMKPSDVLNHFALHTVVFDSVCVATQAFCSKSQILTRPSIALS